MTGQTHTDPIAPSTLEAAIRRAIHQDILECVEDYLAGRQSKTMRDEVGPLVERILGSLVGEAFRSLAAAANPPKIPDSCDRCGYPGEMLDVGICTECGTGSYAHTDACPVGQAIERAEQRLAATGVWPPPWDGERCPQCGETSEHDRRLCAECAICGGHDPHDHWECASLAEEVDDSICGECGRGDYDHRLSCAKGLQVRKDVVEAMGGDWHQLELEAAARAELRARDAAEDLAEEKARQEAEDRLSRQAQALPKNKPRLFGGVDLPEAESEMEPEEMSQPIEEPDELLSDAVERDLKAGKHLGHDNRRTVAFTREGVDKIVDRIKAEAAADRLMVAATTGRPLMREADGDVDRRYKAGLMRPDPTADAALGAPPTPTVADTTDVDDLVPPAAESKLNEDQLDELARAVHIVRTAREPITTTELRRALDVSDAWWAAIRPALMDRVKVDTVYGHKGKRGKHTLWSPKHKAVRA